MNLLKYALSVLACAFVGCVALANLPAQAEGEVKNIRVEHVTLKNGLDMAFRRSGHGRVPIVLIHGYSLSSQEWSKVMPLLPQDKFTAYAVDLRGFGDSAKPKDGNNFEQIVDDLSQFLNAMHLTSAVMVGHSMGGSLLQDFVLAHQTQVKALVLSDAFARNEPPIGISAAVQRRIEGYGGTETNRVVFQAAMPKYFDAENVTQNDIKGFVFGAIKASDPALKGLLAEEYTIAPIALTRYKQITVPTLIIVGAHDNFVSNKQVMALTNAIPGVRLTAIIPRTGHTPMWEQPDVWTSTVLHFLEDPAVVALLHG